MMKNAAIICVGLMLTLVTASGKEYDEGAACGAGHFT